MAQRSQDYMRNKIEGGRRLSWGVPLSGFSSYRKDAGTGDGDPVASDVIIDSLYVFAFTTCIPVSPMTL